MEDKLDKLLKILNRLLDFKEKIVFIVMVGLLGYMCYDIYRFMEKQYEGSLSVPGQLPDDFAKKNPPKILGKSPGSLRDYMRIVDKDLFKLKMAGAGTGGSEDIFPFEVVRVIASGDKKTAIIRHKTSKRMVYPSENTSFLGDFKLTQIKDKGDVWEVTIYSARHHKHKTIKVKK